MIEARTSPSGHFSPLRYPGGKGKLASFVSDVLRSNALQDGLYVEPYAGGAAVACELLLTGVVRKIAINDLSRPIFAFWNAVLYDTVNLVKLIRETEVTMGTRSRAKEVLTKSDSINLDLAFATFFLNRTNRSGILNGGVIGGVEQKGDWKIDARYNKENLISRIEKIARMRTKISLTNMDAVAFLDVINRSPKPKTLIYLDPPYFVKGRELYYDFYQDHDHQIVASTAQKISKSSWIISYDDTPCIHSLYTNTNFIRYAIGYSAREHLIGSEVMFFSPDLRIPTMRGSMKEIERL